ncbi:ribbon-helix-helix protein, CopG family [Neolewinella agarilytica]|uniref:Ribbon-helix-helix protein, copG family n=1 Tax=Neolewinella agarilytica TaxID=478744 RepID=A0A1H9D5B4_9BACT|nr:ribbon-helix-helix protein, CopG family [Neolewinella agarilytica]SEQ08043.1 Ribbon-helix-helix protein, copG family [Neolewinella agarilytica]
MDNNLNKSHLGLRLHVPVMDELKNMAEARGETVSSLVRDLIREELQRNGVAISITTKIV